MYPFERFTEAAKGALSLAQGEAERTHHGYIGTEHLLIALVRQEGTVAGEALARIGVREIAVRERVDEILGSDVRDVMAQIVPTSRTKTVIEISFREAQTAGSTLVRTDHILLALIDEGTGVAAHVLAELGATAAMIRTTVGEVRAEGVDESASSQLRSSESAATTFSLSADPHRSAIRMPRWMAGARVEATADLDQETGDVHLFRYLLRNPEPRIAAALRRVGVDPEQLRDAARPPEHVLELRRALDEAVIDKRAAATREDYPAAEAALQQERHLREQLDAAELAWQKELSAED